MGVSVQSMVRVLDADPMLGWALEPDAAHSARRMLVAEARTLKRGPWEPGIPRSAACDLGLLIVDGVVLRQVRIRSRRTAELLGAGDLIRPWQGGDANDQLLPEVTWQVVEPATIAVLDGRFGAVAAHWPSLLAALIERAATRSRSLALRLAIAQEPNVCERLLMLLTHLADRWGRVGPDGVVIPLRLSQELLADLVAARRQSVCCALGELRRVGSVSLRESGHLVLSADVGPCRPDLELARASAG
jgi:CRP/FNR family cyclic AMP-dependent transcriptional regulator